MCCCGLMREMKSGHESKRKKIIHSVKVGIGLVLVSLLYIMDPLFHKFGQNAMWAVMNVVVVFEFYAGATVSKGINRGIGTLLGGGLGCLVALFSDQLGGLGRSIVISISVFVATGATYLRLKTKRYDYGAMIFILTFNLVAVSGVHVNFIRIAVKRLITICIGFVICIFIGLLVFPIWAGGEFHRSTASKFHILASSLQRCLNEYFQSNREKEKQKIIDIYSCKPVLHSKSKDESLANFAKWEPWHGKFGFSHPWDKYSEIGEGLREIAATIISLHACIQSAKQPSRAARESIREPCETIGGSIVWMLREMGESIEGMKICRVKGTITPKAAVQETRAKLSGNKTHRLGHSKLCFLDE